jgi:hypothetical protein
MRLYDFGLTLLLVVAVAAMVALAAAGAVTR